MAWSKRRRLLASLGQHDVDNRRNIAFDNMNHPLSWLDKERAFETKSLRQTGRASSKLFFKCPPYSISFCLSFPPLCLSISTYTCCSRNYGNHSPPLYLSSSVSSSSSSGTASILPRRFPTDDCREARTSNACSSSVQSAPILPKSLSLSSPSSPSSSSS